jgi:alanyl-tRNA synthetase
MSSVNQVRSTFLDFFARNGHAVVPSSPLVPRNDPTLMFTSAGMVQFKNVFTGQETRSYTRATTAQKCVRAGGKHNDLDNVGYTNRHHTFFEMLGNFSFGDYFKEQAIPLAWELVTKDFGLDRKRLLVTIYHDDEVAYRTWKKVAGFSDDKIIRIATSDNFWSAGETGPCGPCSEIFYDRGEEHGCGRADCRPGCECDRYMEFYNLVFMQYDLRPGNDLVPLPNPCVDTGLGLERGAMILQDASSNFDTDGFRLIMDWVERESGVRYGDSPLATKAHRVLADHGRAMTFLIADGVTPSNEGRGYIARRIIRRAVQYGQRIGLERVHRLPAVVIEQMSDAYPELREHAAEIDRVVKQEEERFRETLARGLKEFEELASKDAIPAEDAFVLATTYGFPIELTQELAEERGQPVDIDRFRTLMEEHREVSRAGGESTTEQLAAEIVTAGFRQTRFVGYEKTDVLTAVIATGQRTGSRVLLKLEESPFYAAGGGQVSDDGYLQVDGEDTRYDVVEVLRFGDDQVLIVEVGDADPFHNDVRVHAVVTWGARFPTMANHTATHLLHAALREVLGDHVKQAGSAVRPDKLRFDFSHTEAMTAEEREKVERIVNEKVFEAIPVRTFVTPIEEARKLGAMMLFGEKYGDEVRVVEIDGFSRELCGGTHVRSTAEIGPFVILSEASVGSGARRIEAVTAGEAWEHLHGRARELDDVRAELEQARREAKKPKKEAQRVEVEPEIVVMGETNVIVMEVEGVGGQELLDLSDRFKQRSAPAAIVLGSREDGSANLVVNFDDTVAAKLSAGDVVKQIAPLVGGGGGGRPTMARAGGKEPDNLPTALARARELISAALS